MEFFDGYGWAIPVIIGIIAAIKIITQVAGNFGHVSYIPVDHNAAASSGHTVRAISPDETGPIIYFANDNHHLGDNEYRFNYKKVSGSWRAYILRMPELGDRNSSGLVTHRKYDNGQPYVCWDSPVNTLTDMQAITRVWADSIQEYIATGKRFG